MRTNIKSRLEFLYELRMRKIQILEDNFRDLITRNFSAGEISQLTEGLRLSILSRDDEVTPEQDLIFKKLVNLGGVRIIEKVMHLRTREEQYLEDLEYQIGEIEDEQCNPEPN